MKRTRWKQRIGAAAIAVGGTWAGATVMAATNSAPVATTVPTGSSTVAVATNAGDVGTNGVVATTDTATPINDRPTAQIVTTQSHSRSGGS